jgi:Ca2+/Na+ antiporter
MYKLFYSFSDWIIIWYILYQQKIIDYNPKFAILIGIVENIISLIFLCKYSSDIIKYKIIVIHFIIKLLMFSSLSNTKYILKDIIFTLILYIIYNIWLKITFNKNITKFYIQKLENYKK